MSPSEGRPKRRLPGFGLERIETDDRLRLTFRPIRP